MGACPTCRLPILDFGFGILDCAPVKSALPFHICENLTGQGLLISDCGMCSVVGGEKTRKLSS